MLTTFKVPVLEFGATHEFRKGTHVGSMLPMSTFTRHRTSRHARLRKVIGYRHLPKLRDALKRELKIDTATSRKEAA